MLANHLREFRWMSQVASTVARLLMAVLLRQVIGYWVLFGQEWHVGERIRQWRQPRRRKRQKWYKKAKPFEGLTRRPVCLMCQAAEHGDERIEQREPPAKIEQKRGAKRRVDTSRQFCPEQACRYYGWLDRGNIVSNGHPGSGRWRQLHCVVCGKYFQETLGTIFYGSGVSTEDIVHAIALLCEGVSPRKVARVYKVDKDTVLGWLREAAGHSEVVLGYMMYHLHLEQVQMDELYALLSGPRGGEERGKCWVWASIDPISKLLLAIEVGDRSLEVAQRLVHGVMIVLAPGVVPLFVTDQLAAYGRALLGHYGQWVERVNEQSGRVVRRWVPEERLLSAWALAACRRETTSLQAELMVNWVPA